MSYPIKHVQKTEKWKWARYHNLARKGIHLLQDHGNANQEQRMLKKGPFLYMPFSYEKKITDNFPVEISATGIFIGSFETLLWIY